MKILMISFEFGPLVAGGLGRVINGVTNELRHQLDQLDVFLIHFNPLKLAMSGRLYRCDSEDPARLVASFAHGSAEEHCARLMAQERYDVVHVLSVNASIGKLLAAMHRHAPQQSVVYSVHNLVKHEQGLRKNPTRFLEFEQQILERASLIHVLNTTVRGYLHSAYPHLATTKDVRVIGNGIPIPEQAARDGKFARQLARRLKPGVRTFICLSRWAHGKGLEHFVSAAERVLGAGHDVQFVLAGRKFLSWEKQWYEYVWRISRMSRRVGERLIVLGWLDDAKQRVLYDAADACVMPSDLEYYPYSVLEPAAAGVPLICSDLPCVSELLSNGKDCLMFRTGDAVALARTMERLLALPDRGRSLAENAQRKVLERCSWREIARQYREMYRDVAALAKRPGEAA